MLSIHNLSHNINDTKLFINLNITLLPSCILYLKGGNGSGKTTLLRLLAGISKAQSGEIIYNSRDITDLDRPYCTYIGHLDGNKIDFSVLENLKFWSKIYDSPEALEASIHYFNLYDILDKRYYQLSAGNKKKVALSRLLACQSNLWLLDEIDANLDTENKDLLNNLIISKANNGGIVIISSHNKENSIKSAVEIQLGGYKS